VTALRLAALAVAAAALASASGRLPRHRRAAVADRPAGVAPAAARWTLSAPAPSAAGAPALSDVPPGILDRAADARALDRAPEAACAADHPAAACAARDTVEIQWDVVPER
jgi:hypothetical protein